MHAQAWSLGIDVRAGERLGSGGSDRLTQLDLITQCMDLDRQRVLTMHGEPAC